MGFVIATAGHVDHGKSSIIKALTGITTARYREEIEREITIDIGFAYIDVEGAGRVSIVDVPGHEDFVHNMLAGISGARGALLVVAANEGIMPQTVEHFEIIKLCGIERLAVVLNKCDLASPDDAEYRRLEIEEFLAGSRYAGSPVVPFSAATGAGREELVRTIRDMAVGPANAGGADAPVFFPVDRVFEKSGYGQIVTGTLISGTLERDASYEVTAAPGGGPGEAASAGCRVRSVESHGKRLESLPCGARAAVNVTRDGEVRIARGSFIVSPELLNARKIAVARVAAPASARSAIKSGTRVKFYFYTACYSGKLRLIDAAALEPGGECLAEIVFTAPAALLPFRNFVLRRHTDEETIGGGVIVGFADSIVKNKKKIAADHSHLSRALLESREKLCAAWAAGRMERFGHILAQEASLYLGAQARGAAAAVKAVLPGFKPFACSPDAITSEEHVARLRAGAEAAIAAHFAGNELSRSLAEPELMRVCGFDRPGFSRPLAAYIVKALVSAGVIRSIDGAYSLTASAAGDPAAQGGSAAAAAVLSDATAESIRKKIEARFAGAGLEPGTLDEVKAQFPKNLSNTFNQTVRFMESTARIIKIFENYYMSAAQDGRYREIIAALAQSGGGRFDVISFKEATGLSRKYAIGILEYYDRAGFTARDGNERVIK